MEALLQLSSRQASRPGVASAVLDSLLGQLQVMADTAADDVGRMGLQDSAAFASQLEEISRTLGYLQIVAAGHLDRTRSQEPSTGTGKASGWTTGWATDGSAELNDSATTSIINSSAASGTASSVTSMAAREFAQEFRNTGEYLRSLLRISAAEARRRLALAAEVLPRLGLAGQPMPPRREELAATLARGSICTRSATTITMALEHVRPYTSPDMAARMEHALTVTAAENDPDFLARISRRWAEALNQDGTEPSEEQLRHSQGAFLRRPRNGLQHLEIFATTDQFEHLLTVMNTATNPRTYTGTNADTGSDTGSGSGSGSDKAGSSEQSAGEAGLVGAADGGPTGTAAGGEELDRRSRAQKLLDGLVGACKLALATGTLPATGGLRPQILVTIDYQTLLAELRDHGAKTRGTGPGDAVPGDAGPRRVRTGTGTSARMGTGAGIGTGPGMGAGGITRPESVPGGSPLTGTGSFAFSGPATARSIRQLACDADIIPLVLGGAGQVLDIGRASRIFPPHIRKAITARDKGCAFPGCTIPAPWCEAHHISYWSHGGPTSTHNGTLLCSHHHHLVHKENWHIEPRNGAPWFIPPPHIDPRQQPRQNHYFHT
ncbi:HNH endonuclease signature motif containing protein [Arthrobacter sp. CJ23]|uniref:HNH endonuclease signature motif containing protein n=1 Tax=Arthrobacter sp. CJ23 TaxID=2972479 RepID=UPI00215C2EDC|nr:HNH endonuclease signature motif containing protein [Arthrobacter sp. CJ23]UVJ40851.1 HNH endonuclease [Arthrobacter sp. CJ23]